MFFKFFLCLISLWMGQAMGASLAVGPATTSESSGKKLVATAWEAIKEHCLNPNIETAIVASTALTDCKTNLGLASLNVAYPIKLTKRKEVHRTFLMYAAAYGTRYIIDIDRKNPKKPIRSSLVETILEEGASKNVALPITNETALHFAAVAGKRDNIEALFEYDGDRLQLNAKTVSDDTSLILACKKNPGAVDQHRTATYLIDCRADVNVQNKGGFTALMYAVQTGNFLLVKNLLAAGANPDPAIVNKTDAAESALSIATRLGFTRIIALLESKHAYNNRGWLYRKFNSWNSDASDDTASAISSDDAASQDTVTAEPDTTEHPRSQKRPSEATLETPLLENSHSDSNSDGVAIPKSASKRRRSNPDVAGTYKAPVPAT